MKIEILQLIEGARKARGLTVIIDVFRAMTVESFLMSRGTKKLFHVGDVQTAWDYKVSHPDTILCDERGGAIIDGFDFGNSPSAIEHLDFTGKTVIHTTSAGTQGKVTDMEIDVEHFLKIKKKINEILAEKTGKSAEQVKLDSERDKWMSAEEAKEYGLIDKVIFKR